MAAAVKRHREQRYRSREQMSEAVTERTDGKEKLSPGTIQNVESGDRAITAKTLRLLDLALGWEPGTAQGILTDTREAPADPALATNGPAHHPPSRRLPRRLEAELEDRDVLDVRALDLSGSDARVVITLVGGHEMDLAAVRAALLELDGFERRLREGH